VCCHLTLHDTPCQAQGPQKPSQEAPCQVCTGSGAAQGPGARRAASPQQCTCLCWRGHGYQVTGGQEHTLGLMCARAASHVPSCIHSYFALLSSKRVTCVVQSLSLVAFDACCFDGGSCLVSQVSFFKRLTMAARARLLIMPCSFQTLHTLQHCEGVENRHVQHCDALAHSIFSGVTQVVVRKGLVSCQTLQCVYVTWHWSC